MIFDCDKIILDLCAGSGAWSKYYRENGYDVRLITLPDNDVTDYIPPKNVYGILAAPPCTEFSRARNGHPDIPRDFHSGMIPVNACYRIIFHCKLKGSLKFWALENPVGLLSRFLGSPVYTFHPWQFGDAYTKFTALWGEFNRPVKKYDRVEAILSEKELNMCRENRKPQDCGSAEQKAFKRGITPDGFAKAFFEVNR
ncbi:MAG: hypothetical protein PVI90_02450 [Desulfobacteraceae bacterium]|jgi:site-specific DNA-cytosine methylase